MRVKEGTNAKFTCDSLLPVHWSFNNGTKPPNAIEIKNSLYINSVTLSNTGNYECQGFVSNGTEFGAIGHLSVISKSLSIKHQLNIKLMF